LLPIFLKIDLMKGYHNVPVPTASITKMVIVTPFELFEYVFILFGLRNSAQSFQQLMDKIFRDLGFHFTYVDDSLIASHSATKHLDHLHQVFQVLADNRLSTNLSKGGFGDTSLDFLRHRVSAAGLEPQPRHMAAIQDFPPPTNIKNLQKFLGLVNFYQQFLPGIVPILKLLTSALVGCPKNLPWTPPLSRLPRIPCLLLSS
jgi:hypothetical protein